MKVIEVINYVIFEKDLVNQIDNNNISYHLVMQLLHILKNLKCPLKLSANFK